MKCKNACYSIANMLLIEFYFTSVSKTNWEQKKRTHVFKYWKSTNDWTHDFCK